MSRLGTGLIRLAVVAVVAVCLGIVVGWLVCDARHFAGDGDPKDFVGTVTLVGGSGSEGCVRPDGSQKPLCSAFFVDPSAPSPKVGDHVHASFQRITAHGSSARVLVLYSGLGS